MKTTPKKKGRPSTKKLADLKMTDAQREEYRKLAALEEDYWFASKGQEMWRTNWESAIKERNHYAKKADKASTLALILALTTVILGFTVIIIA